jgi:mgtE-like transporter
MDKPRLTTLHIAPRAAARRFGGALLGADPQGRVQSLAALTVVALSSVVAGLILGGQSGRLEELPGLLLLVPAATALRGNVFGALGSRLGTSIHTGTFDLSGRLVTVVGQNVWASGVLALTMSTMIAIVGKGGAELFGIADAMGLDEFIVISVIGGLMASVVVLSITLALAAGSVRFGWDPDNVTAPLVTAAGDLATLPALMFAAVLVGNRWFTIPAAIVLSTIAAGALTWALRSRARLLRQVVVESLPVLLVAALLELFAGVSVENQLESLAAQPELLVVLPGFLAAAGALGGILSSRLSSKLHLGLTATAGMPDRAARADIRSTIALAVPVFAFSAVAADVAAGWFDLAGPSLGRLVGAVVAGGIVATLVVVVVAYYGTVAAVRFGFDPDTYGIPLVTSVLDLTGALTLLAAIEVVILT